MKKTLFFLIINTLTSSVFATTDMFSPVPFMSKTSKDLILISNQTHKVQYVFISVNPNSGAALKIHNCSWHASDITLQQSDSITCELKPNDPINENVWLYSAKEGISAWGQYEVQM